MEIISNEVIIHSFDEVVIGFYFQYIAYLVFHRTFIHSGDQLNRNIMLYIGVVDHIAQYGIVAIHFRTDQVNSAGIFQLFKRYVCS